jgi:hypothetical protein
MRGPVGSGHRRQPRAAPTVSRLITLVEHRQREDALRQAQTAGAATWLGRRQVLGALIGGAFFLLTGCKGTPPKPIPSGKTRKYLKGAVKGAGKSLRRF